MLEKLLLRPPLKFLFKLFFRVEVIGLEHYYAAGERVIIAANHQSYLDPPLLSTFLPDVPAFAINIFQAEAWYIRFIESFVRLYRLDPSKPMSMKRIIQDLRHGVKVVIFPEGRITTSGGIMKIYEGTGLILEKTGATVLPVRIDGAEYSKLSRLPRKLRQRCFPKIRITILPPVKFEQGKPVSPRVIYDLMTGAAFAASDYRQSLLDAVLKAYAWHGGSHVVASDFTRVNMTYRQLFTRAFVLRQALQKQGLSAGSRAMDRDPAQPLRGSQDDEKYVGVMLPSGLAALVTFFSLQCLSKIPCMLNFSAGVSNILHACRIATVKTVLTSRVFVEKGKLEPVIEALQKECNVIYLEDIRATITLKDKLAGLLSALLPRDALRDVLANTKPDDPAVILYTSGSEGAPKGVALSHANLLANMHQTCTRLDLMPSDILFNAMPVFHSFGLTVGMLLPVVRGIKTFLYPTPLHYRIIPDLVYDTDATIMIGTDTFYNGYAHYAHPYDFWNIRLAVAGAEKLKEKTRRLYADTFGVRIMEGYGVTESSPIVSFNTPLENKTGTVGRPFPGIECKTTKVEGMAEGGRLLLKGPNIMLGYLKADQPGTIQPNFSPPLEGGRLSASHEVTQREAGGVAAKRQALRAPPHDSAGAQVGLASSAPPQGGSEVSGGWYDTGDIVSIDEDGFIRILGRAKRFAKIGGEMVSLVVVEELAADVLPDACHAAIAVADERKGEQIILFTEAKELSREQLMRQAKEKGIADISLPRQVIFMEAIPRLGNGKIDYVTLSKTETAKA